MSDLLFEVRNHVALLTINRPEVLNAMHSPLKADLISGFERLCADDDVRVAILTGTGERAFCVGADLKWRAAHPNEQPVPSPARRIACSKPFIAAVNGYALGGGFELALACDIIIAAEHAQFGFPEVRRGLMADGGGIHRLPRQIPSKQAMGLLLTGTIVGAAEVFRMGLVNEIVPMANLRETAERWAALVAECSPLAVQATKQAALQGLGVSLEEAIANVFPLQQELYDSEDFIEGPRAFAEKRAPVWTRRRRTKQ